MLRLTRNASSCLIAFLTLTCSSAPISPLQVERCITGETSLLCKDKRLEPIRQDYSIPYSDKDVRNKVCTKARDWASIEERIMECEALIGGE
jgi:hypothetical protein